MLLVLKSHILRVLRKESIFVGHAALLASCGPFSTPLHLACLLSIEFATMPKVPTKRTRAPEGFEVIEPTLRQIDAKMRDGERDQTDFDDFLPAIAACVPAAITLPPSALPLTSRAAHPLLLPPFSLAAEAESHEGKRKNESIWPVLRIHHQRSRYVYEMFYQKHAISREVYDYCIREGHADANLIAKWKKEGYEKLCCLRCIQTKDTNYGTTCICRVPKSQLEPGKVVECLHCGCRGCASEDAHSVMLDVKGGELVSSGVAEKERREGAGGAGGARSSGSAASKWQQEEEEEGNGQAGSSSSAVSRPPAFPAMPPGMQVPLGFPPMPIPPFPFPFPFMPGAGAGPAGAGGAAAGMPPMPAFPAGMPLPPGFPALPVAPPGTAFPPMPPFPAGMPLPPGFPPMPPGMSLPPGFPPMPMPPFPMMPGMMPGMMPPMPAFPFPFPRAVGAAGAAAAPAAPALASSESKADKKEEDAGKGENGEKAGDAVGKEGQQQTEAKEGEGGSSLQEGGGSSSSSSSSSD